MKSVLVFNKDNIVSLETGNLAASHFAEKPYFITYFHVVIVLWYY